MTKLRVAPDLALPLDTATSTLSLLAMKGSGKTHTASVLAEEMLKAKIPIVAIDPTGAWWGLRSSADGQAPGFPVVVMGGEHADVPLDVGAGELVARFLVEERPAGVVLDLSLMRKAEAIRFMTPFIETLYHRNREVLHVFWDECDLHIPQKPFAEQARLLGAAEDLVRRGRIRGLGVSLISQRPAVVNKDVLTQTETLVVLRMTGPQDVKAVQAWVNQHDIEDIAPEMLASLPSLPKGDSWWWSPGALGIFQHTRARERETFDSSRTPKVGERVKPPKVLAPVDLERLRTSMAETIEKAKADDPKTLRAEIARLKAELQRAQKAGASKVTVSGGGFDQASIDRAVQRAVADSTRQAERRDRERVKITNRLADVLQRAGNNLKDIGQTIVMSGVDVANLFNTPNGDGAHTLIVEKAVPVPYAHATRLAPAPRPAAPRAAGTGGKPDDVSGPQWRMLNVLAEFQTLGIDAPNRAHVAVFSNQSSRSSGWDKNLSTLRTKGYIEYPDADTMRLTAEGAAIAVAPNSPRTLEDLHEAWLARVSGPQRRMLQELITVYDAAMRREDLAAATNQSPASSGWDKNLSTLRSLGLIDYPDRDSVVATALLFPEGLT